VMPTWCPHDAHATTKNTQKKKDRKNMYYCNMNVSKCSIQALDFFTHVLPAQEAMALRPGCS
jgi:hypothetical protein